MWIWAYSDGFLWTERIKRIKRIKTDKIWFSLIWLDCLIYLCDFFRFNLISFWPPCTPLYPGGVPFLRGADGAHSFDLRYDYDRIESQIWFYFRFAKFSCISAKCRHIVHSIIARRTGNSSKPGVSKQQALLRWIKAASINDGLQPLLRYALTVKFCDGAILLVCEPRL